VWQFPPTKKFEATDFEGFLRLLPRKAGGREFRHVLEVRHKSFSVEDFVVLARRHNCAICFTDSEAFPSIADISADFIYARLQNSSADIQAGYAPDELDKWRGRAQSWALGDQPGDLPYVTATPGPKRRSRDVFIFFIAGAKEKNPAAACALIERLTQ